MNEEKLRILVDYLKVLSGLEGYYHKEIRNATKAIEHELGLSKENKYDLNIDLSKKEDGSMIFVKKIDDLIKDASFKHNE